MKVSLRGRDFIDLLDWAPADLWRLLDLSKELKAAKYAGRERPGLAGKNIALIFEKTSTRTRCAFEVGAYDQGAHVTYLGPGDSQLGKKESIADTARVLSRMFDGIEYRGRGQKIVEELAQYAAVPVYNGLTDESHPTQFLADAMTMLEHSDRAAAQVSFCFLGDCRFNMANSLMIGGCKLGMDVRICGPRSLWPDAGLVARAHEIARATTARLTVTDNVAEAVAGVDFVHTDVWVSMGEPESVWEERTELLNPYQVNQRLIEMSGNADVKFMHCLPAYHDRDTEIGEEIYQKFGLMSMEVTDEVFNGPHSIVFDQAENRLHTVKAILVATLAG